MQYLRLFLSISFVFLNEIMARICFIMEQFDQCIYYNKQAKKLADENNSIQHSNLNSDIGLAQYRLAIQGSDRFRELAFKSCRKALELYPDNTSAMVNLGLIYKLGELIDPGSKGESEAAKLFKAAVDKLIALRNQPSLPQTPEEIFIRQKDGLVKVPFASIYYVEVIDDYLKFTTANGSYMVLGTLKYLEQKLDPSVFIKPHRSWIVNTKYVEDFSDGKLLVKGKFIPVSKQNKLNVVRRLNIL